MPESVASALASPNDLSNQGPHTDGAYSTFTIGLEFINIRIYILLLYMHRIPEPVQN